MSKKKIFNLISIAVLVVLIAAASMVSYSIATKGHGDNKDGSVQLAENTLTRRGDNLSDMTYMTNIDLIIDNAVNADEKYNIVEIIPNGSTASDLKKYVDDEGFSKYVITANKDTSKESMPAKMINYTLLTVHAGMALSDEFGDGTVQTLLDDADLIYVNSPGYTSFNGTNNMSEELFNYLHVYALGDDKPIIMNYVTKNSTSAQATTYQDLINAISRNYVRFRTYAWGSGIDAEKFFNNDVAGSYYLKYNVNQRADKAPGSVLVVYNSPNPGDEPGTDSMYQRMKECGSENVIKNAYFGRDKLPDAMHYTFWNLNANNQLTTAELDKGYDYILLENGIQTCPITDEIYKKLKSISEASKYILYDGRMSSASSSGETVDATANNYLKLMDMLISNKGVARYAHVLSTNDGFFTSLDSQGAEGTEGAKAVADIINAGDYRGSGTSGANGKKFRVLELQPCYPIDLDLAKTKSPMTKSMVRSTYNVEGNYYENPSEVMSGVTKDEVEAGTEYYAFELSKAKISKATGLKMDQIQVDQMSTDELISHKNLLLETYDLIYVGGNVSALTPLANTDFFRNQTTQIFDKVAKLCTYFNMYTHTGISVPLLVDRSNNKLVDTNNIAYGNADDVRYSTWTELNGNDITHRKLEEFQAYIKAGMPIIFEKKVTEAFEEVKNEENRLKQLEMRNIDPDSFMYDLLDTAYTAYNDKDKKESIVWGFNATGKDATEIIDNSDKAYGNTLGGVTVFTEKVGADIAAVVNASATRPILTLTKRPKDYIEGNPNSYNEAGEKLSISGTVTLPGAESASIDMALYTDYNGDGVFSNDELADRGSCKATADAAGSFDLTYEEMDEDFYGLVSWKVVATAANGACAVTNGYAYYPKKEDVEKKVVRILEIMPVAQTNVSGENEDENDGHSLYLCPECQLAEYRAKYNVWSNGIKNLAQTTSGDVPEKNGVKMGLHQHKFGIVKFDSTTMDENWDSNIADVLMDDYEFELDIITAQEFDEVAEKVAEQTEEDIEKQKYKAQQHYAEYLKLEDELAKSTVLADMKAAMEKQVGNTKYVKTDRLQDYIDNGEYYKFWLYNVNDQVGDLGAGAPLDDLKNKYNAYIAMKDKAIEEYNEYINCTRLSGDGDTWMLNNFDIVVLGFAEDFGGRDLSETSCEQLQSYIDNGGSMLNTHDATTRYKGKGATNLTNMLRSRFGMDRFHVTGTDDSKTASTQSLLFHSFETPGWEQGNGFSVKDTDINLTVKVTSGNGYDIQSVNAEPVGSAHASVDEPLQINITVLKQDETPVQNKTICISDSNRQNAKSVTTDGDGKATLQWDQYVAVGGKYQKYVTEDNGLYFWTERAMNGDSTTLDTPENWMGYGIRSVVGVTDPMAMYSTQENHSSPYLYAQYEFQDAVHWNQGYTLHKGYGTDGASQVNDGIVTTYPFTISSELRISGTHAQTLALDMEDDQVSVWYTLSAGSSVSIKTGASLYAASPHDGMDNYYLYSKGNIFYCGAGHTVVTGPDRDNNDERRLFINVIVNSVRNKGARPKITVHEPDGKGDVIDETKEDGNIFLDSDGSYYYNIDDTEGVPEFDFKVKVDSTTTLKQVYVYYDLNYGITGGDLLDDYSNDKNHVMIAQYNTVNADKDLLGGSDGKLEKGALAEVRYDPESGEGFKYLKLKSQYFEPYGGQYTYIVIKAIDGKGNIAYKRIKIKLIPKLFDLT